jgi:hypothetical protein
MTEITEASTHEDITAAVDDIIQSRSTPEKTDALAIAEERDKPVGDMTAEEDSGKSEDPAEEEAGEADGREWLDDKLKADVAAYGIDEKELEEFSSREEVERALRIFDRTALDAGRKAMAEEKDRDDKGRFSKKEPEEKKESTDGRYEISLDKDVYDEGLVAEFAKLRDHYEDRIAALETRFVEADSRAEEERFDGLVDTLGHADLFGKSGKETTKELQRRQDLFIACKAQQIGLQQLGRPVDLDESLINRVARMVFAEELGKKDLKNRTRKVAKQSNGRMGGSVTKAHESVGSLRDEMRHLYKELEGAG